MNSTDTGAPRCARHPKVETYLKCARCGTPICPECAVDTPVGYKCRDCGRMMNTLIFQLSVGRALAVVGVGLAGGLLAGVLLPWLGFWGMLLGIPYGQFVGELILRVSGRKIGLLVDILTGASIVIGGLIIYLPFTLIALYAMQHAPQLPPDMPRRLLASLGLPGIYALITLIIVAAAAVSRVRFSWSFWKT